MRVSVVITVLNEEKTVAGLLDSLLAQDRQADEIVIVDGGSTDRTGEIIRHFQQKDRSIRVLIEKCSRAKGRNIGIDIARNEIIAMTDAGCIPENDWLEKITKPLSDKDVEVVAGYYQPSGKSALSKAEFVYLGVLLGKFDTNFLPSTRSMAFKKSVWEKVGGFPENLKDTAEDTGFNYKLIKNSVKITPVKNAVVEWGMPQNINEFFKKIFAYAKGDAQSKIWIFPTKGFSSHNIMALLVIFRYLAALVLLVLILRNQFPLPLFGFLVLVYMFFSFRKVYGTSAGFKAGLWGIPLQFASDLGVMAGFIYGIF
jgi:glycosyltransferase involved in cell wall biosynthesis